MAPQASASYYGALVMDKEEKSAPASGVGKRVAIAVLVSLAVVGVAFLGSSSSPTQESAVVHVQLDDCECTGACQYVSQDTSFALMGQNHEWRSQYEISDIQMCSVDSSITNCQDVAGKTPANYGGTAGLVAICSQANPFCSQREGSDGSDKCGTHGFCIDSMLSQQGNGDGGTYHCVCETGYADDGCGDINECAATNNCNANAECLNNDGSYDCQCNYGWEGTGIGADGCTDIDQCLGGSRDCGNSDRCEDLLASEDPDSWICHCSSGWDKDDPKCLTDIDECLNNECPLNTQCQNEDGSYRCDCKANWEPAEAGPYETPNAITCIPHDFCAEEPCANGGTCTNGPNGCGHDETEQSPLVWLESQPNKNYRDQLFDGYEWGELNCFDCECVNGWMGERCAQDVNECEGEHGCDPNSDCVNTAGSYECVCHLGWEMKNVAESNTETEFKCVDINDCADISPCAHGGTCQDCGTLCFTCECVAGWRGTTCGTDWDECQMGIHVCNDEATCKNNPGSYDCKCDPGWTGDGFGNNKTPLTVYNEDQSVTIAMARSNAASFLTGLAASPGCVDINDCGLNAEDNPCKHGASCVDLGANHYKCTCTNGWRDANCDMNVNECNPTEVGKNECHPFATCHNRDPETQVAESTWNPDWMPLGYECKCNTGYSGNGITCVDIDDCAKEDGKRKCDDHGFCSDQGRDYYTCQCDQGWIGQDCDMDENECVLGKDNCGRHAVCTNVPGSFECSCRDGYTGDPTKSDQGGCSDINDCGEDGANPCKNGATCTDRGVGSYECSCADGWTDFRCDFDVNECRTEDGSLTCHENAVCVNIPGSFECTCLAGYRGDGLKECVDIDDCANDNGGCENGARCENLPGNARICHCAEGFRGCNDPFCATDCDECLKDPCDSNADCEVDGHLYTCTCNEGWFGDGKSCNQCTDCNAPPMGAGYKVIQGCSSTADTVCQNIDECFTKTDQCHPEHGGCFDTEGSYECECEAGYWGDGYNEKVRRGTKGCTACTVCQDGFHEVAPCTPSSDRVCSIDLQTGDYMIESEADGTKQCLAILNDEWFPTRVNYGNNGDDSYCGIAITEDYVGQELQLVKSHAQFVWTVTALYNNEVGEDSQLYTIAHKNMDSSYDGASSRCLFFGNKGQDIYPSLQSCVDYETSADCPWGNGDGDFCDFRVQGVTNNQAIKEALVANGQAIFKIQAVKMIENKYIVQSQARTTKSWECLAFEDQGAATNPSRYNWGNGAEWCGVGDWDGYGKEMALLNNKQAVFIFTQLVG